MGYLLQTHDAIDTLPTELKRQLGWLGQVTHANIKGKG